MVRQLIKRICSDESGFTIIELSFAAVILGIMAAPISAVMIAASAESAQARMNTSASQILQSQLESLRTLSYSEVGIVNGNPPGALSASQSSTLSNGTAITITTSVKFVNDSAQAAQTNADYKAVTITLTRNSDNKVLATTTTNVSAASAPPNGGSNWVQIQRTTVDAVNGGAIPGVSVTVTGGPNSITSTDTTDATGAVLFPALTDATAGTPVYSVTPTLTGYNVYPDDLAPRTPSQVSSAPTTNSITTLRMYKPATLTVNLKNNGGSTFTAAATVSLESTRCGVAAQTVSSPNPSGQVTFTTCQYANGKTVNLVPNVTGQTPNFDKYVVTFWTAAGAYGWTSPFTIPSGYPTTLTQTATVTLSATSFTSMKTLNVTVKNGASNDTQARVYVTCSAGPDSGLALYGVTNGSGVATFQIPTNATASTCAVGANDQGAVSGTSTNQSWSSSTSSPIALTVTES